MSITTQKFSLPPGVNLEPAAVSITLPFANIHGGSFVDLEAASFSARDNSKAQSRADSETLALSLSRLGLSFRANRCLREAGIETIGDLVERTSRKLLGLPQFGETSLREVKAKLRDLGLALRDEAPPVSTLNLSDVTAIRRRAPDGTAAAVYVLTPALLNTLDGLARLVVDQRPKVWFFAQEVAVVCGNMSPVVAGQNLGKLARLRLATKHSKHPYHGQYGLTLDGWNAIATYRIGLKDARKA